MSFYEFWEEVIPAGDCFRFATKLAVDMLKDGIIPDDDIYVVHGIVHPKHHPREYWHAWVEAQGKVYDWQMRQTKVGSLPITDFYELYQPKNTKKYTPARAVGLAIRHSHAGPWH